MSRNSANDRPSTPPSSLPTSPTNPRDVALRTPLKISRSRHQSFAPFTPQSLRASKSPPTSKNSQDQANVTTPTRKLSSTQTSNWRVHEDTLSDGSGSQEYKTPESATPTKRLGPFTPQVTKQTRDPLRLDISNYSVAEDPQVRGSLTDPPPRRRMGRSVLSDENSSGLVIIKPLDINVPIPRTEAMTETRPRPRLPDACASCGSRERLSLLQPCQHHICASCVTGSLNIVGEKSMICMHCHSPIHSFQISDRIHPDIATRRAFVPPPQYNHSPNETFPTSVSCPNRLSRARASPEPVLESSPIIPSAPSLDNAVLRIDNVPWDVTPTMLEQWLGGPIVQCHVLLDRADGRTLSHAYIETSTDAARAALSSHQNKTLGYGRRLRPVTLTLSGQEELMHDLFPSWTGKFKGTTPIHEALLVGSRPPEFLTASELSVMLHLIQKPQSHFLKVPCLAYWALLSTLVKFPVPDVFAPGMAPDILFDITTCTLSRSVL
ncbi:hypothetical protein FRC08_009652 [Ceratobasidium sp. 394]|nr:hypothetical protein FRC08_009652 [Ceratobasidium sp. 394]